MSIQLQHKMVLFQVPDLVRQLIKERNIDVDDISAEEFLTMVCSAWKMDINRAKQYTYAAAVFERKIKAVFNVKLWTFYDEHRVRFIGNCNQKLTCQYYNKDVSEWVDQNPVRYI